MSPAVSAAVAVSPATASGTSGGFAVGRAWIAPKAEGPAYGSMTGLSAHTSMVAFPTRGHIKVTNRYATVEMAPSRYAAIGGLRYAAAARLQ